ncbi:MAG: DUF2092 domain-containing protein [Cyanobacteria bacterium P01_H01_bin.15]
MFRRLLALAAILGTGSVVLPATAQELVPVAVEPEPMELLKSAIDSLTTKPFFSVDADITYDNVLSNGSKVQYSAFQEIYLTRPNKLRVDYEGDLRARDYYFDGTDFTVQDADLLFYASRSLPGTTDELITLINERLGVDIPLSNLFLSDPYAEVAPQIQESRFIGTSLVLGQPTYHLLFVSEDVDWQVWIAQDPERPVFLKLLITYKNLPNSPQYTALFRDWDFETPIDDETFTFEAAPGVGQVDFLPINRPLSLGGE